MSGTVGSTSATLLRDLIDAIDDCDHLDDHPAWRTALTAADREAVKVFASCGVLSDEESFYRAVARVADAGFDYAARQEQFESDLGQVGDDRLKLALDESANAAERAKWRGAYALGVAIGLRLSGGAR